MLWSMLPESSLSEMSCSNSTLQTSGGHASAARSVSLTCTRCRCRPRHQSPRTRAPQPGPAYDPRPAIRIRASDPSTSERPAGLTTKATQPPCSRHWPASVLSTKVVERGLTCGASTESSYYVATASQGISGRIGRKTKPYNSAMAQRQPGPGVPGSGGGRGGSHACRPPAPDALPASFPELRRRLPRLRLPVAPGQWPASERPRRCTPAAGSTSHSPALQRTSSITRVYCCRTTMLI